MKNGGGVFKVLDRRAQYVQKRISFKKLALSLPNGRPKTASTVGGTRSFPSSNLTTEASTHLAPNSVKYYSSKYNHDAQTDN